ncbi:MAG: hypothetical protein U9Q07_06615, partial [Planctomycetota bacterium]|nr:hypothetical protein [Planctomycetota bacterium]
MPDKQLKDWWTILPDAVFGGGNGIPKGGPPPGGQIGYTGAGPDGQVQPERRVPGIGEPGTDKHEGEWIFSADEVQAIGADVLQGMSDNVKGGNLDVNQLRQAVGQQPRQGLQIGSGGDGADEARSFGSALGQRTQVGLLGQQLGEVAANVAQNGPLPQRDTPQTADVPLQIGAPVSGSTSYDDLRRRVGEETYLGEVTMKDGAPTLTTQAGESAVTTEGQNLVAGQGRFRTGAAAGGIGQDYAEQVLATEVPEDYTEQVLATEVPGAAPGEDEPEGPDAAISRALSAQAGIGAAKTGALKQELAQAGVTGEGALAALQVRARDTEGGMSQLMADIAANELKLQLDRDKFQFLKDQYGDEEFGRMSADIKAGATFEQMKTKYPDLTREDYDAMSRVSLYDLNQTARTDTTAATGGYLDQQLAVDPNYVASGAWESDPMMIENLSNQWQAHGMEGDFNIGNPAHAGWAATQMLSMSMTPEEVQINRFRGSTWYQNLEPDEQANVDGLLGFAQMMAVTGGYSLGSNPDGSTFIQDVDGNVIYGDRTAPGIDPNDPTSFSTQDVTDAVDALALEGVTADPYRVRQYMEHYGGRVPTANEFRTWDSNTGDVNNVLAFLNGEAGVELQRSDRTMLGDIAAAQQRVRNNPDTASDADREMAGMVPFELNTWDHGTSATTTTSKYSWFPNKEAVGRMHRSMSYNSGIYAVSSRNTQANFTPAMRTKIEAMA